MGQGASSKAPLYTQNVDSSGNVQGSASNPTVTTSTSSKSTTGGLTQTAFRTVAAASGNAALVKAGAATLYAYSFANTATSWRFVHLFNKATAPVLGTDNDARIIPIPPGGMITYQGTDIGVAFPLGLGIAVTTAMATNDGTVAGIAVGDVTGMLDYA